MCAEPWQNSTNAQNSPRYLFAAVETWISRARDACSMKALGRVSALSLIIFSLLTLGRKKTPARQWQSSAVGLEAGSVLPMLQRGKFSRGKILQKTPPQHGFGGGNYKDTTNAIAGKRQALKTNRSDENDSNHLRVRWGFSVVCCWLAVQATDNRWFLPADGRQPCAEPLIYQRGQRWASPDGQLTTWQHVNILYWSTRLHPGSAFEENLWLIVTHVTSHLSPLQPIV